MSTRTGPVIRSDECGLDALIGSFTGDEALCGRLVLGGSWPRRWSTAWLLGGGAGGRGSGLLGLHGGDGHCVLDHLSSQRRPLTDSIGLQPQLLEAASARAGGAW